MVVVSSCMCAYYTIGIGSFVVRVLMYVVSAVCMFGIATYSGCL